MRYIQFYQLSTGYVPGTIPPQFDENKKKPIEVCGSNGVLKTDQRKCISASIEHGRAELNRLRSLGKTFIGFRIYQGASYSTAEAVTDYIKAE